MTKQPFSGLTLTVTAPSRQWVRPEGGIDWALRREAFAAAEALGFSVREMAGTAMECARFAGDDAVRAADLMCALIEVESDLVMAMRGGYGAARILPLLDWTAISDALSASPRPIVGFSDMTAVNLALLSRTGMESWQGPTLRDLIDPDPLTLSGLETVLGRRPFEVRWQTAFEGTLDETGKLWGGNLAVLTSLLCTPWFPAVTGGFLFVEDVAEPAYRIERMLLQLADAGILRSQKALIVGDFRGADKPVAWPGDFSLSDALSYIEKRTGIPVIRGLPFGHIHAKCSLPVGRTVRLSVRAGEAILSGERI